ncbi:butyrophilin subfamily 3 member A3-like [Pteronotus mesoamericanus]|uniref:butyrophilin subfamily 3 member A3-like n=1 Tax=Pteronotus mesoamericanus TaxID=1884717 RepID=UPI0023EC71A2|nr:butyrophilin subfamily 3 member A3-like [Pteronotus parnellii mesoamericanus]
MARGPVLRLRALPVCLALVQLLSPCSAAQFAVVGPPEPILALVGEDAELPCHLSPRMSAQTMELRWVRPSLRQVVHTYTRGQEDTPAAEFYGRTSMLREDITAGKAVLLIRDVRASDSGIYWCYFQDGEYVAKAQVELQVAGLFFQSAQPLVVAFAVTLVALLLLLIVLGCFLWGQQKIWALTQEKERERAEKEAAQVKLQQERSAKEKLQDELRWRRIPYLPREEQSQAYAELKTALFQPADVLLDPDTAHPALRVSEDQRSLWREDSWEDLPDAPGRFTRIECVLGCASFTSGRRFWEVDVGDRKQWRVGLCRDNVSRKGGVKMSPENGFWTVGLYHGSDYQALTDPPTKLTNVNPPERVGVFLDYDVGQVSFYNALDGSHIFSFPHTPFSGPLRPVFRVLTAEGTPLTLCAAQRAVGTSLVPVPGPDPSPETPGSLGSAEWNGDPQAEVMCVLAAQSGAEGPRNRKRSEREQTY